MSQWLHISDLHAGLGEQDWLWPNLKHLYFEDIKKLEGKNGPADFIIFTGDLTQKAHPNEFEKLTEVFVEIRENLAEPSTKFLVLPGNHDLGRPQSGSIAEGAIRGLITSPSLEKDVFGESAEYREILSQLFEDYTKWFNSTVKDGLVIEPTAQGILPGDASYRLEINSNRIAVVTLNSAWMQVNGADYFEKLHISSKQLFAVTQNNPVNWLADSDFSILATHHPKEWLSANALKNFQSQIAPAGRFDMHLFGHMHEHQGKQEKYGGGDFRREMQAASLFGLEYYSGKLKRSHGHALHRLTIEGGERRLRVWPRTITTIGDGSEKLVPDQTQGIDENNGYDWTLPAPNSASKLKSVNNINPSENIDAEKNLKRIRYHISSHQAHNSIRFTEREDCVKALQDVGTVWNITDWGNGEDEFLHTVSEQLAIPPENIFRFDLDGYKDRDWLLHFIKTSSGVSFEMLCELISQKPRSLLIFDNIASDGDLEPGKAPIEHDLEELASIVKNYSPESKIVLRGKPSNQNISLPHTTLRSLDEAEVLDYLRSHKSGGNEVANADNITRIWRYTGGSPPRIDTLLRELEVTSLDELISADQGVALTMNSASTPDALVGAVESLRQSEAPLHQRAFTLLEALSILPRGEKLSILKRFYGPTPLHPSHAIELFSRRLADTMTLPGAIVGDQSAPSKVLVSPKIVRDYVASLTADPRSDLLRSLALEMYFQDEWKSGEIKSSLAAKVCRNPLADPYQIANLTSLILTEIAKTIAAQDTDRLSQLTALSSSISKAMLDGNHYRHASLFCGQVLSEIQSYSDNRRIDVLKYLQGRALRMIGRRQEARNVFEEIELKNLSGSQRRSWNLEMAFIAEQEDQPEDAVRYAKVVLKKRGDGPALQAEQIIAEQIGDQDSRLKKLRALEKRARSLRLPIAANNLSLSIATETPDDSERESHLEKVMASGHSDKDFYNQTRAIIRLMDTQAISQDPKPQYIAKLAEAYQHLYNERSDRLFDKCHKALWNLFGKTQQAGNLFSLFRYSSFTWRLRGEEAKEAEYLDTLAQLMKAFSSEQRRMLSRELDYFRSRASRIGHQGAQENKSIPPPSAEQQ